MRDPKSRALPLGHAPKREDFTIVTEELEVGEHIIAVKLADDVGNTTYKTFEVDVKSGR